MTTAHRPTWEPAMATSSRTSAPTQQFSVRDLPAHTQLKTRSFFFLVSLDVVKFFKFETKKIFFEKIKKKTKAQREKFFQPF